MVVSSFLSFSFRFVVLQILRFTMRDWLALPLNSNSSDEAATTDDENGRTRDMIKKNEQDKLNELQGLSAWFSILSAFGVASKHNKKASSDSSSNRSIDHCPTRNNNVCKQDHSKDLVFDGETTDEEVSDHEEEGLSHQGEEEEHVSQHDQAPNLEEEALASEDHLLVRTFSVSSIASSVETYTSTPASSEIMRSPHNKYNTMTDVKIYWNHGGKKVQVTGEFDNWSVSFDMVQDSTENRHVIEIPMDLTRDIEFKFIVDGEWRYANDLPHRTDWRGNVNNVIYKQEQDLLQS